MATRRFSTLVLAWLAAAALLLPDRAHAQLPGGPGGASGPGAADFAEFFSQVGDQIYEEDCIFELSQEQLEVQQALVEAYVKQGASNTLARQLAVKQIRPPTLSDRCREIKNASHEGLSEPPVPVEVKPVESKKPVAVAALPKMPKPSAPSSRLADKKVLSQWDCAPGVDYVTIRHKGYERKLTDGEICNPFDDVVRPVAATEKPFRFGYAIRTGRLFVVSDEPHVNGKTIAWAISGRDACRNNPDPDCLAARAVGPLPPGEYVFASSKEHRVSWGPTSKRMVAGIFLKKLWYREKYTPAQTKAILARGNIAIHVRLKGEMSEACLGLGPKGWAYVSSLIKEGRVTGVDVHIDEPYPQIAEAAPIVKVSAFSLSSLFK